MNIVEARRRTLGKGVYKKTVEGNPAIAQGSLARRYPGITMQGWTTQDSTDGTNLIDYTQAAARTENQSVEIIDGGIKWTGDYYFIIPVAGLKKNQNYIMSYKSDDAGGWKFSYSDGTSSPQRLNGHAGTTDPEKDCDKVIVYKSNPTVSGQDMVFTDIMLNEGSTALPYEPYTGGQPSPNPDYPQPITSAGNWNEKTQKWEYEITIANEQTDPDKNQTVTLTSERPLTKWDKLEKRNGQWGWVYKSGRYTVTGEEFFISSSAVYHGEQTSDAWLLVDDMSSKEWNPLDAPGGYCEKLSWSQAIWGKDGSVGFTYNVKQIHIRLNNADVGITSEDTLTDIANKIKEYVGQQYQEGNQFVFWYETAEEAFVPLSESEQEQMNALYTFRPTTVLSNDCECNMKLTYKTKKSMGGVIHTD